MDEESFPDITPNELAKLDAAWSAVAAWDGARDIIIRTDGSGSGGARSDGDAYDAAERVKIRKVSTSPTDASAEWSPVFHPDQHDVDDAPGEVMELAQSAFANPFFDGGRDASSFCEPVARGCPSDDEMGANDSDGDDFGEDFGRDHDECDDYDADESDGSGDNVDLSEAMAFDDDPFDATAEGSAPVGVSTNMSKSTSQRVSHMTGYTNMYLQQLYGGGLGSSLISGNCRLCKQDDDAQSTEQDGDAQSTERIASVWCETCKVHLCSDHDAHFHRGPILCPNAHERIWMSTGYRLGPKERISVHGDDGGEGIQPLEGVFLRCDAVCPRCGFRDWEPWGSVDVSTLIVVTAKGRFTVDRVGSACRHWPYIISPGDMKQYVTAVVVPVSFVDVRQVWCAELVSFLRRLRAGPQPGLSSSAVASALTNATMAREYSVRAREPPVRGDTVTNVLELAQGLESARIRDLDLPLTHKIAFDGNCVGTDGNWKLRQDISRTLSDTIRVQKGDNIEHERCLPDWIVDAVLGLEPRQRQKKKRLDAENADSTCAAAGAGGGAFTKLSLDNIKRMRVVLGTYLRRGQRATALSQHVFRQSVERRSQFTGSLRLWQI